MLISILIAVAVVFYGAAGLSAWRNRGPLQTLAAIALLFHAGALGVQLVEGGVLRIGVNEALSLFAWQSALLLWIFCFRDPVQLHGMVVYPLSAVLGVWAVLLPSPVSNIELGEWQVGLHILLSLLSAGLLTLAAVQSVALAVQDRLLHRHAPAGVYKRLPPLQTMERLLFQMVAIGFALLSLTLLSGLWFVDNWLAQHLAHKALLSTLAWLLFGVLLWGRWRYGWRGRTAIRWALAGYGMLVLSYFGTKLILEQVLGTHWAVAVH